jgi:hypothetical protein
MTDIQDVSVIGGPGRISVELDFGAQGIRGSQIFAGIGNPNQIEIGQSPILNDLFIDVESKIFYQYQSIFTVQEWVPLLQLDSTEISTNKYVEFSAGSAVFEIDLSEFVGADFLSNIAVENIGFVFSIEGAFPIAYSIFDKNLSDSTLQVTINAAELFGGTFEDLDGIYLINSVINFVSAPEEIIYEYDS